MLTLPPGLLGRDIDLGRVDVTTEELRRYAVAIGDDGLAAGPCRVAPLGFALALRGGPLPDVELAADTISVHGGHTITLHAPLTAPAAYRVSARIADVFEKNGRSGPLTVLARRADIRANDGSLVASIEDQQIVRWKRSAATAALPRSDEPPPALHAASEAANVAELEVGSLIGPQRRLAPSATAIAAYAQSHGGGMALFVDRAAAHALGYRDVIVPGPLQAAILETMLRNALHDWTLRRIGMTFRVSVHALEPIALTAIVVEHHLRPGGDLAVCDLSIENSDGERAALGVAELVRV
jgi:hydroxyacyl-ACP dehydratase HTD2-like protein with hotdog domain